MQDLKMGVASTEEETQAVLKVYSKEDYSVVNRFESELEYSHPSCSRTSLEWSQTLRTPLCSDEMFLVFLLAIVLETPTNCDDIMVHLVPGHGGGWGYSAHSVEAIRFCADADILLGGLGLFGGRGEYTAKIKVRFPSLPIHLQV